MCILTLLLAAALAQSPVQNLVKNGGFDRNLSGWTVGSGSWGLDELTHSGAARVSNPSYRLPPLKGLEEESFAIWQCVKIDRNQEYELQARSRMSPELAGLAYGAVELTWFSNSKCNPQHSGIVGSPVTVKLTELDGKWHDLALHHAVAPEEARSVEIQLQSVARSLNDRRPIEVWFDNVSFGPQEK